MKIVAIVVTYNGEAWINRCIDSLLSSSIAVEPIVLDNSSTDSTCSILRSYGKAITLVEVGFNSGFGYANNWGFKVALERNADYVLLLNQDAWVDANCIEGLANVLNKSADIGVLSPLHFNGEGTRLDRGFAHYVGLSANDCPADWLQRDDRPQRVCFINAAIWLVPIGVIRRIGGFDPLFSHYGEDKDWVNRLLYHNYQIAYLKGYKAYHDREERASEWNIRSERVYFLTELKNIRYSFLKAYAYSALASLKKAISKGHFGAYVSLFGGLNLLLPRVMRHRYISKRKKCAFL